MNQTSSLDRSSPSFSTKPCVIFGCFPLNLFIHTVMCRSFSSFLIIFVLCLRFKKERIGITVGMSSQRKMYVFVFKQEKIGITVGMSSQRKMYVFVLKGQESRLVCLRKEKTFVLCLRFKKERIGITVGMSSQRKMYVFVFKQEKIGITVGMSSQRKMYVFVLKGQESRLVCLRKEKTFVLCLRLEKK